jgi:hypothetical protein
MSTRDNTHGDDNHRPEVEAQRAQIVRFRVERGTSRPDPEDPTNPDANIPARVAICRLWDGINKGQEDIPVATGAPRKLGDEIFATRPLGGTGVTNPESATTPGDPSTEQYVIWKEMFIADTFYRFQVGGFAAIAGKVNKWSYAWLPVKLIRANSWGAADVMDAELEAIASVPAYNTCEANNGPLGVQGNSVDVSLLPAGTNILPIQGNPIVRGWVEVNCDGFPELMFTLPNAITTVCPA